MNNVEKLHRTSPNGAIRVESTPGSDAHWVYMHADAGPGIRPCFRRALLDDLWAFMGSITLQGTQQSPGRLRHMVLASDAAAFNLGGDLDLFAQLIRENNREKLLDYARRCVEGVHHIHAGMGGDMRTIALLQGDALGGGMEVALACQTIVAEEGLTMGLPEVLFGLFPGMGAYSFLCKRVAPQLAEKLILDGVMYSSEEMHRLGIVDILVPKGEGPAAVEELIRRQQRAPHAHLAMNAARNLAQQVSLAELMAITELWVDAALALGDKSLRMMDRLVKAQHKLVDRAVA